jgi:hypothetical protein
MVIHATGTSLSPDIAQQRIRACIDTDPRIKKEIDDRVNALLGSRAFSFLLFPPFFRRSRTLKKPYTSAELDKIREQKARDEAIYAQYIEDDVFAACVDAQLT